MIKEVKHLSYLQFYCIGIYGVKIILMYTQWLSIWRKSLLALMALFIAEWEYLLLDNRIRSALTKSVFILFYDTAEKFSEKNKSEVYELNMWHASQLFVYF